MGSEMCIRDRLEEAAPRHTEAVPAPRHTQVPGGLPAQIIAQSGVCLLYTSDAADERSSVDLGGRRIIKKTTDDVYSR